METPGRPAEETRPPSDRTITKINHTTSETQAVDPGSRIPPHLRRFLSKIVDVSSHSERAPRADV